jgi:hypothetical protein
MALISSHSQSRNACPADLLSRGTPRLMTLHTLFIAHRRRCAWATKRVAARHHMSEVTLPVCCNKKGGQREPSATLPTLFMDHVPADDSCPPFLSTNQ